LPVFGNIVRTVACDDERLKVIAGAALEHDEYLHQRAELESSGKFLPVIDRSYTFDQMVAGHHYVDKDHQKAMS
jgi:hypothetical protein